MTEEWRPVAGYEDAYEVSNLGRIRRVKIINPSRRKNKGHMQVSLTSADGVKKTFALHRLVAAAFIPNPENKPLVVHTDNDAENNRADNLEWADEKDSTSYGMPVVQVDPETGQDIAEYANGQVAADATGTARPNIAACLAGRIKTAGGFLWKYKDTGTDTESSGGNQHEAQG